MKIQKFISSLLLTTAASSTFAFTNQEIVTLLNQQAIQPVHHLYHGNQISNDLNWSDAQSFRASIGLLKIMV